MSAYNDEARTSYDTNELARQRVVVMTGATAGIGEQAVRHIVALAETRVIVGARGAGRRVPEGVEVIPLDLASLASVRGFAQETIRRIGLSVIDILILNAGIQAPNNEGRSADGYELIFAVNHLAHYLLARLLVPYMAENGRLVITTSETHDPAMTPIAPRTLDPLILAHPTESGFGMGIRAYAASKLCNLLTAQYFRELGESQHPHIKVIAYSPGLTPGTSLGRDSSMAARAVMTVLMHTVFRVVGMFKPEYVMGTPEQGGQALAEVALGLTTPPPGKIYLSLVKGEPTYPEPSEMAQNRDLRIRLWQESATMVGLSD